MVETTTTGGWSRRRLLGMVAAVMVAAVAVVTGLGYAVHAAVTSTAEQPADTSGTATPALAVAVELPAGTARRDAIAAAPMLAVSRADSRSGEPTARTAPTIAVPPATVLGAAEVPTGFPHTQEGAAGQLAAITSTVLQGMSMDTVRAVHEQWTLPGAPAIEDWELTAHVQAFLTSAAGAYADDPLTSVITTPVAAQVKGIDGEDWVLACVLLDVTVSVITQAQAAYGHCERMQWDADRWVIGPGLAPASAPSTWPGTDLAIDAGWRTWTTTSAQG